MLTFEPHCPKQCVADYQLVFDLLEPKIEVEDTDIKY